MVKIALQGLASITQRSSMYAQELEREVASSLIARVNLATEAPLSRARIIQDQGPILVVRVWEVQPIRWPLASAAKMIIGSQLQTRTSRICNQSRVTRGQVVLAEETDQSLEAIS